MSSGPEGEQMPSRRGRIYVCICSKSCAMQEPLDVAGGSIYDNAQILLPCNFTRLRRPGAVGPPRLGALPTQPTGGLSPHAPLAQLGP
jgi:hypothetical protein